MIGGLIYPYHIQNKQNLVENTEYDTVIRFQFF